ncbi:MAG: ribosome rescue GTPase HflX [Pseudomonadota bacterium]|nr:ribosome rescue GTPase HflX [Pseudomonadota bacterium]
MGESPGVLAGEDPADQDLPNQDGRERVLLVYERAAASDQTGLTEAVALVEAAGAQLLLACSARVRRPNPRTFIASGKVAEIADLVRECGPTAVVFDFALSPIQERNLEKALCCRVVDRTALILDIFAQRARTYEGKLQVELAQLNHLATRLVRGWTHLERQKGGIGLRGPGETQLETDRRLLRRRQVTLESRLDAIRRRRGLGRRARQRNQVPTVALVGYTNAGKSTLFNRLTGASVFSADKFFATLDPTLRRVAMARGSEFILADTVGFIRDLPAELVMAFRATLEEVVNADLLLHVVDASEPNHARVVAVREELERVGAGELPELVVLNKADLVDESATQALPEGGGTVRVSARTGEGCVRLLEVIAAALAHEEQQWRATFPFCNGELRARLFALSGEVDESFLADGRWQVQVSAESARLSALCAELGIDRECFEAGADRDSQSSDGQFPKKNQPCVRLQVTESA